MRSLDRPLVIEGSKKRRTISAFIDKRFRFVQDQPILRHRLALSLPSLAEEEVTAVFPELRHVLTKLNQGHKGSPSFYAQSNLSRTTGHKICQFDLQIESVHFSEEIAFLLTIICHDAEHLDLEPLPLFAKGDDAEIARLARHNSTLQLLNHAGRILTETLDAQQVTERLLQVATQIIGAAGSSVWLWEGETDWLICRAAFHPGSAQALVNQRVQRGQGVAGWVAETGECAVVGNTSQDQRFTPKIDAQSGFTTDALIAVPLMTRGAIIGVLEVVNKLEGEFDKEDLTIVEMLAASASIAIDNAYLVERLRQQMDDLRAKNEELDAFDHTVAHNLQNPLALIIGFADILQASDRHTKVQQQQAVQSIVGNAQKMSDIVHELLLLSSVRKSEIESKPLDTAVLVNNALKRLETHIHDTQAQIIKPDTWPVALGHPGWIEEVWENYLSNAIKYGGQPPHIEIGAVVLQDGRIQFWVKDNGKGFANVEKETLFSPFTRLNQISVTGHGLGLSIVRRIMEKLDGEVGVTSAIGAGSTFSFTLPPAT